MTITIEELLKVYEEAFQGAIVAQESQSDADDAALLAVYRLGFKEGAERQRAVEPTMEMTFSGGDAVAAIGVGGLQHEQRAYAIAAYRAMQSVAPLVVPE